MITQALKAIAACLDGAGVPYMVIGGQAVLQYGESRFTQDLDITIASTPDESEEIVKNLLACGFKPIPPDYLSFIKDTWVLPVEHLVTGTRADIIFSILPFERDAIRNAEEKNLDGAPVRFIGAEDLVIQKIFSGRPRDIEDAEGIIRLQKGRLDLERIKEAVEGLSREMGDDIILGRLREIINKK